MTAAAPTLVGPRCSRSTQAQVYGTVSALGIAALDLLAFLAAALSAEALVYRTTVPAALGRELAAGPIVFVVLWVLLFYRIGLYRVSFAITMLDELYVVVTAIVLGIIPQLLLFTVVPALDRSRLVLLVAAVFAIVLVGGARAWLHAARERVSPPFRPQRAVLVTERDPYPAALDVPGMETYSVAAGLERPEDVDALVDACDALRCSLLILEPVPAQPLLRRLIERASARRIRVRFSLARFDGAAFGASVERVGTRTLLVPRVLPVRSYSGRVRKRLFDLVVGGTVLLLAMPIMAVAAVATLLDTGTPVLFRQLRVGSDGAPFEMLKFRSMHVHHAGGDAWAVAHDARVTRVGAVLRRFSIDELPQLFNVLRGEMSLVGPRPEMVAYVERFEREIPHYADRHLVKPGITGWSQLYMRRLLTPEDVHEVLQHDLFYIQHWGLFMDLSLVAKTIAEFLFHRPA